MWTITEKQFEKIEQSMLEEYMLRVCKYISDDREFSWILPQQIRDDSEKILDKRMRYLFTDEKYAAEIVKLGLKHPDLLSPPVRDIKLILDDMKKSQKEKINAISLYINN